MDIEKLAKELFLHDIKPPRSININFENLNNTRELFEAFLLLFTEGMKILFGKIML